MLPMLDPSYNAISMKSQPDLWGGSNHVNDMVERQANVFNGHFIIEACDFLILSIHRLKAIWNRYYKSTGPDAFVSAPVVLRVNNGSKAERAAKRLALSGPTKSEVERWVF